jgi:hypothetical protein
LTYSTKSICSVAVLLLLLVTGAQVLTAQSASNNLLISVAFKTDNPAGNSPPISGPEVAATEANPLFGAADVWNNLQFAFALTTNPSFNLVDSTGAASGVNFSITGTVGAVDFWPWQSNPDPLRSSTIFWNSWVNGGGAFGAGESTSITWTLTGLPPATTFDLCVYGSFTDADRSFDMTIQGITLEIPTFNIANQPPPNCVLFTNLVSEAHGTISGVATGTAGDNTMAANEANWSGFQLVEVAKGVGSSAGCAAKKAGKIGLHRSRRQ